MREVKKKKNVQTSVSSAPHGHVYIHIIYQMSGLFSVACKEKCCVTWVTVFSFFQPVIVVLCVNFFYRCWWGGLLTVFLCY